MAVLVTLLVGLFKGHNLILSFIPHPSPDTWIKPDINVDELDHKNYKQGCPGGPKKVSTSFFEWGIFVYSIFLVRWRWRVFLRLGIYCMYLRNIITCLLRIKNVKNWCNLKTTFYDLQFETSHSLLAQKLKKLW